ncbi:MAG: hypothetical protein AB7U73_20370 [Pirellulales bacterium]
MKRSRLALSLVLGILAALATVDRWPMGRRGVAADLPITLADRLCPADFADDRMCTEPFQWFGDSPPPRAVEHTARANVVTPWRPTIPADRSSACGLELSSAEPLAPPVSSTANDTSSTGGFTCGFELEYVLQLARWIIAGEPTWASAGAERPQFDGQVNLEAWLCPHEEEPVDEEGDENETTDEADEWSTDQATSSDDAPSPIVAGPLEPTCPLVPASDLLLESLAPGFLYGAPRESAETTYETAVIDRAASAADAATANADAATLIANDMQMICPAAAARYSWGPRSCDPVIAAELGLAPRTTLEWWGSATAGDDHESHLAAIEPRATQPQSRAGADGHYDCTPHIATLPVVSSLADTLADIREHRNIDVGLELNAQLATAAATASHADDDESLATAGEECGFAEPSLGTLQIPDAYWGITDFLATIWLPETTVTTHPAVLLDGQAVLAGIIEATEETSIRHNSSHDYPVSVDDSVYFETIVNGPTRFIYLRKQAPSRWSTMLDWRAETARAWEVSRRRWPLGSPSWVAPATDAPQHELPLYFKPWQTTAAFSGRNLVAESQADAANWPCRNTMAAFAEQDVEINRRAMERAKRFERNTITMATQCANCLRALATAIESLAGPAPVDDSDQGESSDELFQASEPIPASHTLEYRAYLGL